MKSPYLLSAVAALECSTAYAQSNPTVRCGQKPANDVIFCETMLS